MFEVFILLVVKSICTTVNLIYKSTIVVTVLLALFLTLLTMIVVFDGGKESHFYTIGENMGLYSLIIYGMGAMIVMAILDGICKLTLGKKATRGNTSDISI